ncbi:DUF342 domain-containing protein [Bacillus massilinigeriensis]|uniref:DUF342 domain-containing protein n=1 Tax=Bacillus mediterraneensis TaxID=1805474 RepID=UPI0008F91C81|nr:FapA family protein [Bacillus mediterraneensis]
MDTHYRISLSKDRLTARLSLFPCKGASSPFEGSMEEILANENIVFGINRQALKQLEESTQAEPISVVVAEGVRPVNGRDAYLHRELHAEEEESGGRLNYRDVLKIPAVKKGQLIATIVPASNGEDGIDVTGNPVRAKRGKPLNLSVGKNVVEKNGRLFSLADGQLCVTHKSISVNPLFEVKGDLDLRVGNVNFPGTIIIRGDVPSGYELTAGGDIIVQGTVDAASLKAEGNIFVKGGIASGQKGIVEAEGNVEASYLNQGNVTAGGDVHITASVLNSRVIAGGNIDCRRGTIIGGMSAAGKNIFVKDLGNHLYSKTELAAGFSPLLIQEERQLLEKLREAKAKWKQLSEIDKKVASLENANIRLSPQQYAMLEKQKMTKRAIEKELYFLEGRLLEVELEKHEQSKVKIATYGKVFPNVKVHFGKYTTTTTEVLTDMVFYLFGSEIRYRKNEDMK